MAVKQDFLDYMIKHDFQPDQALEVAAKVGIDRHHDRKGLRRLLQQWAHSLKFWDSIPDWKGTASYRAKLRDTSLTL